jgi:hypothetical protein
MRFMVLPRMVEVKPHYAPPGGAGESVECPMPAMPRRSL